MKKIRKPQAFAIDRRTALIGAGAALATAALATRARAQARIAPPNIIKAGALVMSINPTLPPLQFVDDRGQLQGMRVELGNGRLLVINEGKVS